MGEHLSLLQLCVIALTHIFNIAFYAVQHLAWDFFVDNTGIILVPRGLFCTVDNIILFCIDWFVCSTVVTVCLLKMLDWLFSCSASYDALVVNRLIMSLWLNVYFLQTHYYK